MQPVRIHLSSDLFAPAESAHFDGALDLPVAKGGPDLYTFSEPLSWQVDVTNTGGAFLVTGTVEGVAATACARCLAEFPLPITGEIEGYFLIGQDAEAPEDMDDDEFEVLPDNHTIDLAPLINAALLLEFPLVPLCGDDCLGLCPSCGANLNEGSCGCDPAAAGTPGKDASANPFAVLADYSFAEGADAAKGDADAAK